MAEEKSGYAFGASDRIELIATIVMAAAAILTAWAAFQSAKWSGVQAIEFSGANADRVESTRFDTRAGQLTAIDVDIFLSWLEAVSEETDHGATVEATDAGYQPIDGTLSAFFYHRMRAEFRPALDAWLATRPLINPEAPPTPFQMPEYALADSESAQQLLDQSAVHSEAALAANQNSDNHVLTAVAFALAIFFAGVSSKLAELRNRRITLGLAVVIFIGAASTLVLLPKVTPF